MDADDKETYTRERIVNVGQNHRPFSRFFSYLSERTGERFGKDEKSTAAEYQKISDVSI